jgi:hypothetical protein
MGTMKFILKDGAEKQLNEFCEKGVLSDELRFNQHYLPDGSNYVERKFYIMDPGIEFPSEFLGLVKKVVDQDYFLTKRLGYICGVYRNEGSTLVVTHVRAEKTGTYVWYHISGPTLESVKSLYTLFLQGKIQPEENWDGGDPISNSR